MLKKIIECIKARLSDKQIFTFKNKPLMIIEKKWVNKIMKSYDDELLSRQYHCVMSSNLSGEVYEMGETYLYTDNHNTVDYVINEDLIPYFDGQYPTDIFFDKNKRLSSMFYYQKNGLGGCLRTDMSLPVGMKFYPDGSIKQEHYQNYGRDNKPINPRLNDDKSAPWIQPFEIAYAEDGSIIKDETYWYYYANGEQRKSYYIEHAQFISSLGLNIDNFKKFTKYEKNYIEFFLMPEKYGHIIKDLQLSSQNLNELSDEEKALIEMYFY